MPLVGEAARIGAGHLRASNLLVMYYFSAWVSVICILFLWLFFLPYTHKMFVSFKYFAYF